MFSPIQSSIVCSHRAGERREAAEVAKRTGELALVNDELNSEIAGLAVKSTWILREMLGR